VFPGQYEPIADFQHIHPARNYRSARWVYRVGVHPAGAGELARQAAGMLSEPLGAMPVDPAFGPLAQIKASGHSMRPGQNKRMRGRNRRGPNPLTRSFESNGPDVKVRGTAQHIAEKYTQLARDAHLSGDPVAAESYLQHAEHYYRIIAAAFQAQQAAQNGTAEERDDDDDEDFDTASDRFTFRSPQTVHQQQNGGQPFIGERMPAEFGENGEPRAEGDDQPVGEMPREGQPQPRQDRGFDNRHQQGGRHFRDDRRNGRNDRNDRNFRRDRPDFGPDRNGPDRGGPDRNGPDRGPQDRGGQDRPGGFQPRMPRAEIAAEAEIEQPTLPSFLTAPVRPIQIEGVADEPEFTPESGEEGRGPFRARRRRRGRAGRPGEAGDAAGGEET
jgi:hypothetical protein